MKTHARIIQKYPNRRLYDTLEHRYITLDEVLQFALNDVDFIVLDQRTRVDITVLTLISVLKLFHSSDLPLERGFLIDTIRKFFVSNRAKAPVNGETPSERVDAAVRRVA